MKTGSKLNKVIFIDDEQGILNSLRRLFRKEDFETFFTTDPEEYLKMVQTGEFAVAVSDQRMPIMEGTEVLSKVKELSPKTVRILLTGYADMEAAIGAINEGAVFKYMIKPWDDQGLRKVVREAVSYANLEQENHELLQLTQKQNEELRSLNEDLEKRVQERAGECIQLNKQLMGSFLGSVELLGKVGESYEERMGSHARRVAALSGKLAQKMGLKERDRLEVQVAAFLHDIGKIGLRRSLLAKDKDDRTPEEQKLIETHSDLSADLITMIPNFEKASDYVRYHHENYDGSGYPKGLKEDAIPLGAQIIHIVDEYDKMVNMRTGKLVTPEVALKEVLADKFVRFSPQVADALEAVLGEGNHLEKEAYMLEIHINQLQPGMVLGSDLCTVGGKRLLGESSALDADGISRLREKLRDDDPVSHVAQILRSSVDE